MNIRLNIDLLKKTFLNSSGGVNHTTGELIRLFPFVTNNTGKDLVLQELFDFTSISGEIFRLYCRKKRPKTFSKNDIIEKAVELVETEQADYFKKVFENVCFKGQNPCVYDKKSFLYQSISNRTQSYASYIYDIFLHGIDFDLKFKDSEEIILKILEASLPKLENIESEFKSNCYKSHSKVIEYFHRDLDILCKNEKDFIENINRLFQYYFYYYVTQLVFLLDDAINGNKKEQGTYRLFYSVEWESLSKSRDAFQYGLELLKNRIDRLFQHVVCIELLQCIEGIGIERYTYNELIEYSMQISSSDKKKVAEIVCQIYKIYSSQIESMNTSWDEFEASFQQIDTEDFLLCNIYKLYKAVEFQFNNSSRKGARDKYGKWLLEYGQKVFSKKRGRLGFTHALSQDYILMFVKLVTAEADGNRIRLSDMWNAFTKRGISFDQFSQKEIVNFLDRNNMLEKKSDSGDAQYVTCGE